MARNAEAMQEDVFSNLDEKLPTPATEAPAPLYRVIGANAIKVSKSFGPMWQTKIRAAVAAYQVTRDAWEECFKYVNMHHGKEMQTPKGNFRRGDGSENVIYANLQTVLPAIYSKNPDITVATTDEEDQDFSETAQTLLTQLCRRPNWPGLNLKPKAKKAAMMAELTNFGVLKLEWIQKQDSREEAQKQLNKLYDDLENAKTQPEIEAVYGKLESLESLIELFERMGPKLSTVLPQDLIPDPNASEPDGSDGNWVAEHCWFNTEFLRAQYTEKDEVDGKQTVSIANPTHMISLTSEKGTKMDGLSLLLDAIDSVPSEPTSHLEEEQRGYKLRYMTECYLLWDKTTRRVYLFQKNDMSWPLWAWEDPFKLSRFFPYFYMQFNLGTGSVITPGQVSYYLDQQDNINQINRQVARIRRTVFNYFFYNSNVIDKTTAEALVKALRGESEVDAPPTGVKIDPEVKFKDVFEALLPPSADYEALFNKKNDYEAIDRLGGVSDALRGTQFKTNTNEDAVQSYMEAVKLRIGAKIDCVEDTIAQLAWALLEMAVQFADEEFVTGVVGKTLAAAWRQMPVEVLNATYSCEVVAGSIEKPTSVFKKKEAIQVAQAIGQFANAAPGATLKILLKVLEQAFTEVVIKKADWAALDQEISVMQQKGISTGASPNGAAAPGGPQGGGGGQGGGDIQAQLANLPQEVKSHVLMMKQKGAPEAEIIAYLKTAIGGQNGQTQPSQPAANQQQQPAVPAPQYQHPPGQ